MGFPLRYVAVFALLTAGVMCFDIPCQYTDASGNFYDYSGIFVTGQDLSASGSGNLFILNLCHSITNSSCVSMNTPVCQAADTGGYNDYGALSDTSHHYFTESGGRVYFNATKLGSCYYGGTNYDRRFAYVYLECSTAASISVDSGGNYCHAQLTIKSPGACAGQPPQPGGGLNFDWPRIFMALVAILYAFVTAIAVVLYVVIGMCYKIFYVGSRGVEMIPNVEFWKIYWISVWYGFIATYVGCSFSVRFLIKKAKSLKSGEAEESQPLFNE